MKKNKFNSLTNFYDEYVIPGIRVPQLTWEDKIKLRFIPIEDTIYMFWPEKANFITVKGICWFLIVKRFDPDLIRLKNLIKKEIGKNCKIEASVKYPSNDDGGELKIKIEIPLKNR